MKVVGAIGKPWMTLSNRVAPRDFKDLATTANSYRVEILAEAPEELRECLFDFPVVYDLVFFNKSA